MLNWENITTTNEISRIIEEIGKYAGKVHDDVNQKYDLHPYAYHLHMVAEKTMKNIRKYLGTGLPYQTYVAIIFGAYFHDSIEDARLSYNDVMKIAKIYFDDEHAKIATEIVYALTNEKGRTRAERANDKYYEGIRNTSFAPIVKLSDREANMEYSKENSSSMYKKYMDEHEHFIESIGINSYEKNTLLY